MHEHVLLGFPFFKLLFFFVIYSFIGWTVEVLYAFRHRKIFVNRGFLYGPLCPIYGSGVVLLVVLLTPFKDNIILLFILSTIILSVLEYITGYVLEKVFKAKWWDYTEDKFNLHGRICLLFSLGWGLAGAIIVKFIHPLIELLVSFLPTHLIYILFVSIIVYLATDFTLTIISLINLKKILLDLYIISTELKSKSIQILNTTKEKTYSTVEGMEGFYKDLLAKYKETYSKFDINHKRLMESFPDIIPPNIEFSAKNSITFDYIKNKILNTKNFKSKKNTTNTTNNITSDSDPNKVNNWSENLQNQTPNDI